MNLDVHALTDLLYWHRWKTTIRAKDFPATFVCYAGCKVPWEGVAVTSYMEAWHKAQVVLDADNFDQQLEFVRDTVPEGRFGGAL